MSLSFFDDILIPPNALQHPSKFNETEQAWVWEYWDANLNSKHDIFMDAGEVIKFRVTAEFFNETCPTGTIQEAEDKAEKKVPYRLLVSGCLSKKCKKLMIIARDVIIIVVHYHNGQCFVQAVSG